MRWTIFILASAILMMWTSMVESSASLDRNLTGSPIPRDLNNTFSPRNIIERQNTVVGCGSYDLDPGQSVVIQSENYPNNYPKAVKCNWYFTVTDESSTINVNCDNFHVKRSGNCNKSYLTFFDGISGPQVFTSRNCGPRNPLQFNTESNYLRVLFNSHRKKATATGFQCSITASGVNPSTTTTTTTTTTAVNPSTTTTTSAVNPTTTPGEISTPSSGCQCGVVNIATRIVGGNPTQVNQYPWQVAIVWKSYTKPFCGASIITDEWILTAAHCLTGETPSTIQVIVGEHNYNQDSDTSATKRFGVSQLIVHSEYNSNTMENDIALIKVNSKISFTDTDNKVAPVCLPTSSANSYEDVVATVTGWGTLSSGGSQPNKLYEVNVPTMTNAKCDQLIGGIFPVMICAGEDAGGKDSCQGDSGGPMVTQESGTSHMTQIGIVSWGYGCADANSPGVYARVTEYLSWINEHTTGSNTCPTP